MDSLSNTRSEISREIRPDQPEKESLPKVKDSSADGRMALNISRLINAELRLPQKVNGKNEPNCENTRNQCIYIVDDPIKLKRMYKVLKDHLDVFPMIILFANLGGSNGCLNLASLKTRPGALVMSLADFCQSMYHGVLDVKKFSFLLLDAEADLPIVTGTLAEFLCSQSEPPKILSLSSIRQSPSMVKFKSVTLAKDTAAFPSSNLMKLVQSFYSFDSNGWVPDLLRLIREEIRRLGLCGYRGWANLSATDVSDVRMTEVLLHEFASALKEIATIGFPFQGKVHALIEIISKTDLNNPSRGVILASCSLSAIFIHRILDILLGRFGVRIGIAVKPPRTYSITLPTIHHALDLYAKGSFHYLVSCYENASELSGQVFPRLIFTDSFRSTFHYLDLKKKLAPTQQVHLLIDSLDEIGQAIVSFEQPERGLKTSIELHNVLFPDASLLKSILTNAGARLSYNSACSILLRFSVTLPGCAIPVYKFERCKKGIRCIVNIPHLSSPVGTFSRWRSTQLKAKTEAAFTLCEKLLESELLDDHLFPKSVCLPLQDYSSPPGSSEESECQVKIPKPFIPSTSNSLYLNIVKLGTKRLQRFAIATWSPIPSGLVPITLQLEARPKGASLVPSLELEHIPYSQIENLAAYTLHVLSCLLNRDVACPPSMPYFIVPLKSIELPLVSASVDWSAIHFSGGVQNLYGQTKTLLRHITDFSLVQVLNNCPSASQNTISVIPFFLRTDYLSEGYLHNPPPTAPIWTDVRFYRMVAVDPDLLKSMEIIPSVVERLTDILMARELQLKLGLKDIRPSKFLEAMTDKGRNLTCSSDQLSFLGEAFLDLVSKLAPDTRETLIHVNPHLNSNQCLINLALKLGLASYIRAISTIQTPFEFSTHYGTPPSDSFHSLLITTVKAIVGAAIISGQESLGVRALISFGLWGDSPNVWSAIQEHVTPTLNVSPRRYEKTKINVLEKSYSYTFTQWELLIQAIYNKHTLQGQVYELGTSLIKYYISSFMCNRMTQLSNEKMRILCAHLMGHVGCSSVIRNHAQGTWIIAPPQASSPDQLKVEYSKKEIEARQIFVYCVAGAVFIDIKLDFVMFHHFFDRVFLSSFLKIIESTSPIPGFD